MQWLSIWPEFATYHSLLARVQTIKKIKCHGIFYVTQFYTLLFPQHYLLPSSLNCHKPGYKVKKKKCHSIYFTNLQHLLFIFAAISAMTLFYILSQTFILLWGVMLYYFRSVGCPKFRKLKFIKTNYSTFYFNALSFLHMIILGQAEL